MTRQVRCRVCLSSLKHRVTRPDTSSNLWLIRLSTTLDAYCLGPISFQSLGLPQTSGHATRHVLESTDESTLDLRRLCRRPTPNDSLRAMWRAFFKEATILDAEGRSPGASLQHACTRSHTSCDAIGEGFKMAGRRPSSATSFPARSAGMPL
mmetsp:Transcript_24214/g.39779  ORF Transcript_24214/g.39779 Transcript_24214/m.39779 type:complete len:152 (+) Transcript_24214:222-677(+)